MKRAIGVINTLIFPVQTLNFETLIYKQSHPSLYAYGIKIIYINIALTYIDKHVMLLDQVSLY